MQLRGKYYIYRIIILVTKKIINKKCSSLTSDLNQSRRIAAKNTLLVLLFLVFSIFFFPFSGNTNSVLL